MNNLPVSANYIPAMSDIAIDKVRKFEELSLTTPQINIDTSHVLHGGMYARTIVIPAGVIITGALIKIATILIVNGEVTAYIGDRTIDLQGYNILPAGANRKQAFFARTDTSLTMIFPTKATTVKEAESEFTDEFDRLISNNKVSYNNIIITGE